MLVWVIHNDASLIERCIMFFDEESCNCQDFEVAAAQILDKVHREGGGVVLLHDHARPENPEREDFVLSVTRCLLEMAKNEGFRVCTMRDLRTISYF